MVYSNSTHLSSIISANPTVLSLLNRVGIYLGVGNDTVAQAARKHDIDPQFILVLINTYLNPDYFPEKELMGFSLEKLCDYLLHTNRYYVEVQIPNVGRHFHHLVERTYSPDTNLNKLYEFFLSLQKKMQIEVEKENLILKDITDPDSFHKGTTRNFNEFATSKVHQSTDSLFDLINLFIIHLKGTYDTNLCHAVINALIALGNDMQQNNRIHDRILSPLLLRTIQNG